VACFFLLLSRRCNKAPSVQVAHQPVPFVLIDIREDKSSKIKHKVTRCRDTVQLTEALSDPIKWQSISKGAEAQAYPAASHILIFVHDSKVHYPRRHNLV
jgi:hypothetical protein